MTIYNETITIKHQVYKFDRSDEMIVEIAKLIRGSQTADTVFDLLIDHDIYLTDDAVWFTQLNGQKIEVKNGWYIEPVEDTCCVDGRIGTRTVFKTYENIPSDWDFIETTF